MVRTYDLNCCLLNNCQCLDCSKEVYVDHMSKLNDSFEGPPTKKPAVDSSEDKQTVIDICLDNPSSPSPFISCLL